MIVVYQSFEGQFGDNPRAVYEAWSRRHPRDRHIWLAAERYAGDFPDDVCTVPIYTDAGRDALEAADVLVANTHTDTDWRKRAGAFYLQTWHGTPLKRVHRDVRWAPEGRLSRLDNDVARWDLLLSPNAASTPRLRSAFRFAGPVVETGYPRNDLLSSPGRETRRARVRRHLDLAAGITAILYTPTWRDDDVFSDRTGPSAAEATLPRLLERLGDDQVLLYRCHSFDAPRHVPRTHPRLRDVSTHSEVGDLYLAADVMVTDYSSTMFDFAVTGKPLLHFAPDYERFRDEVRGFYFDLESEAPGRVLRTEDELVAAIRGAGEPDPEYIERYRQFRTRYCSLEDGRATDRVLDLLMSRPRPATRPPEPSQ